MKVHRKRQGSGRGFGFGLLLVGGVLLAGGPAIASNVIDDCGQTCEDDCASDPDCREAVAGKCVLEADVSCDGTEATIQLVSGNDLDLQGYDITCTETSPDVCNYYAITMNDAASIVTSDGSADDGESEITGLFFGGVNCGAEANSKVENLTFFDDIIAIASCKTVENNVIGGSEQTLWGGNIGIFTLGVSNADAFNENYISGRITPILSQGTTDLSLLRNVIHTDAADQAAWLGQGQTSFDGLVKWNVFFGTGADSSAVLLKLPATDDATYEGNLCDENHPDCADCISAGRCEPFTSPFVGN